MDVVAEFAGLTSAGAEPVERALALVAATGRAEVDPEELLGRIDSLAASVPADDADVLCAGLFRGLGFTGNRTDYYDPDNSLLDRVLDRRTGIPITLAVLAVAVGRRRGVPLVGVGMPGHFLLRSATDPDRFFDAFDGGAPLDAGAARRLFGRLHGPTAQFADDYLEETPSIGVVIRVLNNLRAAHLRRGDRSGLVNVLRLQAALPGAGIPERRQLAGVLAAGGRFVEAADLYEALEAEDPGRSSEHRAASNRLRASLN